MYVLINNNETKLCLLVPMVAEFGFMWFPDVFSPFYSDEDHFSISIIPSIMPTARGVARFEVADDHSCICIRVSMLGGNHSDPNHTVGVCYIMSSCFIYTQTIHRLCMCLPSPYHAVIIRLRSHRSIRDTVFAIRFALRHK